MDAERTSGRTRAPLPELRENAWLKPLPYLLAAGAGIITGATHIWHAFYDDVKHVPPFSLLRKERDVDINRALGIPSEIIDGKIVPGPIPVRSEPANGKAIAAEVAKIQKDYTSKFGEALKVHYGITSNSLKDGVRGTFQRLPHLTKNKKLEIAFSTLGSMAVTLGAYLLISQNVRMKDSTKRQDEKLNELGDRIDAQEARRIEMYERNGGMAASR